MPYKHACSKGRVWRDGTRWHASNLESPSLNYQALLIHSARLLLGEVQYYKVIQGLSVQFFETIFKDSYHAVTVT